MHTEYAETPNEKEKHQINKKKGKNGVNVFKSHLN